MVPVFLLNLVHTLALDIPARSLGTENGRMIGRIIGFIIGGLVAFTVLRLLSKRKK